MSGVRRLQHPGNRVVNAVLDQILNVSQIDPTFIEADTRLHADLGISMAQIQSIMTKAANSLGIDADPAQLQAYDMSSREMVSIISSWLDQGVRKAA